MQEQKMTKRNEYEPKFFLLINAKLICSIKYAINKRTIQKSDCLYNQWP